MLKKTFFFVLVSCLCFSAWAAETPSKEGKKSSEPQKVTETWAGSATEAKLDINGPSTIKCTGTVGTCASSTKNPNGSFRIQAFQNGVRVGDVTSTSEPNVTRRALPDGDFILIFSSPTGFYPTLPEDLE